MKGGMSYRAMESRHGISSSTIQRWVKEYELGKEPERAEEKEKSAWRALVERDAGLGTEVRKLRKELEEARQYNKLLNTMIDIAEEQFEIPIRKKPGAKRHK